LPSRGNQRNTDGMEKLVPNMTPFGPFAGLPPLHKVDQTMMRRLRKLANRRGGSVEHLIHEALEQWVVQCQAERELETKIIQNS
jgi:ribbon-helix-helix CopG family protein